MIVPRRDRGDSERNRGASFACLSRNSGRARTPGSDGDHKAIGGVVLMARQIVLAQWIRGTCAPRISRQPVGRARVRGPAGPRGEHVRRSRPSVPAEWLRRLRGGRRRRTGRRVASSRGRSAARNETFAPPRLLDEQHSDLDPRRLTVKSTRSSESWGIAPVRSRSSREIVA